LPHVTDIPGQQAIYAEKAAEARAYVAMDPAPETLAEFPLLAAEVAITAPDAWQLSQVWLNMQAQLRQVGAQSEKLRLGALRAIRTAGTVAELDGILAAFPLSLTDVAPPRKRERLTQNTTF
jgi:threonine dehydrogenase-like Zn-dependent dehydrogenase